MDCLTEVSFHLCPIEEGRYDTDQRPDVRVFAEASPAWVDLRRGEQ
jgi:hypothetical protein